jgi:hypothetical protein
MKYVEADDSLSLQALYCGCSSFIYIIIPYCKALSGFHKDSGPPELCHSNIPGTFRDVRSLCIL